MAFSIEARVPFLDYRLVEYITHKLGDYRIQQGWTKWIFRKTMDAHLPESITWRKDKVGYETPESMWINQLKDIMYQRIQSQPLISEYLDLNHIETTLKSDTHSTNEIRQSWLWFNLSVWLEQFGRI